MHNLGPSLRPHQKFFACFLLSSLVLVGLTTGLYLKITFSPNENAVVYYAQAKKYIDQMESADNSPSLTKLYRDQASYYLSQASLYVRDYDPENIKVVINNFADKAVVKVSLAEQPEALTAAYRAETPHHY